MANSVNIGIAALAVSIINALASCVLAYCSVLANRRASNR